MSMRRRRSETPGAPRRCTSASTPKAVEAIARQMQKRGTPEAALRLGIRGGGCSGFTYVIEFHDGAPRTRATASSTTSPSDGTPVRVVVDPKSLLYLDGTTLEWEQTLMQQGFKFVNPQREDAAAAAVTRSPSERSWIPLPPWASSARFDVDLARRREDASRALARAAPRPVRRRGRQRAAAALAKAVEVNEAWRVVRDPIRAGRGAPRARAASHVGERRASRSRSRRS